MVEVDKNDEAISEIVAKALCEADGQTWEQCANPLRSHSGADERPYYRNHAKAAIEAYKQIEF